MNRTGIALLIVSALCSVGSNVLIKQGVLRAGGLQLNAKQIIGVASQPAFLVGFVLYGLGAALWFRTLAVSKLSVSYPLLVSITFTLLSVAGTVFLHEPLSWQKVIGLVVILAGILIVSQA